MTRRLVVTGATGFIGRRVVTHALELGWQVTGLTRPGRTHLLPAGAHAAVGALDAATLVPIIKHADVVVHLAGITRPASARELERVHVLGSRTVAAAARETGARLVYVSSVEAVGTSRLQNGAVQPLREDDPPTFFSSYGASKRRGEGEVRAVQGLAWVIVRPTAVYGPGDRAFLPLFRLARRGWFLRPPWDPPFTAVHVDDVATGICRAAERDAAVGQSYFIGSPEIVTLDALKAALANAFSRPLRDVRLPSPVMLAAGAIGEWLSRIGIPVSMNARRLAQMRAPGFLCDTARAREALGLTDPLGLEEGFVRTARWYEEEGWL